MNATSWWRVSAFAGGLLFAAAGRILAAPDFENNIEKTFEASPGAKFILDADQGSCEINSADTGKAVIRVLREIKGGTRAQADDMFANHEVTLQQDGNT